MAENTLQKKPGVQRRFRVSVPCVIDLEYVSNFNIDGDQETRKASVTLERELWAKIRDTADGGIAIGNVGLDNPQGWDIANFRFDGDPLVRLSVEADEFEAEAMEELEP